MVYVGRLHVLLGIAVLALTSVLGAQPRDTRTAKRSVAWCAARCAITQRRGCCCYGARRHPRATCRYKWHDPGHRIPFGTPTRPVDVVVDAPGYPTWRYRNVELAHTHPVDLQVALGAPAALGAPPVPPLAATAVVSLDRPPDFVNIGRTLNSTCVYPPTNVQRIDRVPFMVYVRNVLP